MSEEQPKRYLPLIVGSVIVGLLLAVAYPLSFGPYLWLANEEILPESVIETWGLMYAPLDDAWETWGDTWLVECYSDYLGWWIS